MNLEFFHLTRDVIVIVSALATAIIAYKGLKTWQKELKGKANFDVARSLIKSVYSLRDSIEICRNPFISAKEYPSNYDILVESTPQQEMELYTHVFNNRLVAVTEAQLKFDIAALESEALWGKESYKKTNILKNHILEIRLSIDAFIKDVLFNEKSELHKAVSEKDESNIFQVNDDGNSMS